MQFDHEKLDVYQVALQFVSWSCELLNENDRMKHARMAEVSNQLDRASLSILLNIAEGNGKRQKPIRAKFFDDARGSATECAACLDALVVKKYCDEHRVQPGKEMLLRIVSMLCKLVEMYDVTRQVRENGSPYVLGHAGESNVEDDDENEQEDVQACITTG